MKPRKPVYDPQGVKGYRRNGRLWPLPVPFPDLGREIAIPPGLPAFGTREEYVEWVRVSWIHDYQMQEINRWIAEWAGLPARCHRTVCRRKRRCGDPAVLCVYERDAELSTTHYPVFRAAVRQQRERRIAEGEGTSMPDRKTIIADFKAKYPKPS